VKFGLKQGAVSVLFAVSLACLLISMVENNSISIL
jgi:hypothetical protein